MAPVGPDGQNGPFSRSNKTQIMELVIPDSQNGPFSRSNELRSSSPSFLMIPNSDVFFAKNFIDIRNFDVIFAKIFHGRLLRP
ncbi:hypothetical protein H5410_052971 [Solanum commersonii]|uniref:Uncharacterized protein n=1 Tax=Solanum commersonii TaxID=4109 RepID=A0A9J5X5Q7_SOLCO|nr:hypothetical protein H5410_052971 [Solanum commersonii]